MLFFVNLLQNIEHNSLCNQVAIMHKEYITLLYTLQMKLKHDWSMEIARQNIVNIKYIQMMS